MGLKKLILTSWIFPLIVEACTGTGSIERNILPSENFLDTYSEKCSPEEKRFFGNLTWGVNSTEKKEDINPLIQGEESTIRRHITLENRNVTFFEGIGLGEKYYAVVDLRDKSVWVDFEGKGCYEQVEKNSKGKSIEETLGKYFGKQRMPLWLFSDERGEAKNKMRDLEEGKGINYYFGRMIDSLNKNNPSLAEFYLEKKIIPKCMDSHEISKYEGIAAMGFLKKNYDYARAKKWAERSISEDPDYMEGKNSVGDDSTLAKVVLGTLSKVKETKTGKK